MAYKLPQLEISEDDPFQNDVLGRKSVVEFLSSLIGRVEGPFVLALDSPWGSGKTTLIRMLEVTLKKQDYCCINFNAWKVDYVNDPLVALVSSIDNLEIGESGANASFKEKLKKVRGVTTLVAKRSAVAAAKALTAGGLDLEKEFESALSELAGGAVSDIVESFQKESLLLDKFHSELEGAISKLASAGKNPNLVFFVDEIDRCRPTFAIELLERIKHLFDVKNIIFVLSLDKQQLEASIGAVYGQNIKAAEYLRRFIDLEYEVPQANTRQFVEGLFLRFGLIDVFKERERSSELQFDRKNFIELFSDLAEAVSLTLRTQERCLTRLRIVMDQTPSTQYLEPILVALLIVLKVSNSELFVQLCRGDASSRDVMKYLKSLPGGGGIVASRKGILIEALLVAGDDNYNRQEIFITELSTHINNQSVVGDKERDIQLANMIQQLRGGMREISLSHVLRKIDLAAWVK